MTEKRIQNTLAQLRNKKTTFIIAHRLSTIVHADLILVFEKGQIVERGHFNELSESSIYFKQLLKSGELIKTKEERLSGVF
jgi:ATP-binding cassette subfamily B protein